MDSTAARSWALKSIPPLIRESLLHQIPSENCENTIIKFWSLLYSSQFYYVHIPPGLSEKSREIVISYLISGKVRSLMGNDIGSGLLSTFVCFDFRLTNVGSSVIGSHTSTSFDVITL